MQNLTSLQNVKTWLKATTTDDDALLGGMIISFSDLIMSYLERPYFGKSINVEYRNGVGNQKLMLRNWPALSVSKLAISQASYGSGGSMFGQNGLLSPPLSVPAAPQWGSNGYFLEPWDGTGAGKPQNLILSGYTFPRGNGNIQVTYTAGYCIMNEAQTIPSTPAANAGALSPFCPAGPFLHDDGVTYGVGGAALTLVTGSPAQGQYAIAVDPVTGKATYTFATADQGAAVLLNYSYVPAAVERACIQWIGEQFRYRSRIGEITRSLGGQESASYDKKDMPDFIAASLRNYGKWFPL